MRDDQLLTNSVSLSHHKEMLSSFDMHSETVNSSLTDRTLTVVTDPTESTVTDVTSVEGEGVGTVRDEDVEAVIDEGVETIKPQPSLPFDIIPEGRV